MTGKLHPIETLHRVAELGICGWYRCVVNRLRAAAWLGMTFVTGVTRRQMSFAEFSLARWTGVVQPFQ